MVEVCSQTTLPTVAGMNSLESGIDFLPSSMGLGPDILTPISDSDMALPQTAEGYWSMGRGGMFALVRKLLRVCLVGDVADTYDGLWITTKTRAND